MRLQVGEDYRVPHSSQSDVHTSLEHVSTGFRSHRYRYNGAAGGRYVGESPGPGVDWKRTLHIRLLWHLVTWFVALGSVKMILPGTVPRRRASRFERETCRETRIYTTEHPTRETYRRVRAGTTTVVASWTWTPARPITRQVTAFDDSKSIEPDETHPAPVFLNTTLHGITRYAL